MTAEVGDPLSEVELAGRVGYEPELFTVVYHRYFRGIYGYVAGRLGTQAADDVAAETFLVAFGQRGRFDPERGGLRPWLFGIATKLVAQYRRTEARHYAALARCGPELPASSHESSVIDAVTAASRQPELAEALRTLTAGERDVLLLVALGQLSHLEVAEALGISYGTVGSRLNRARKKLHHAIDKESLNGR